MTVKLHNIAILENDRIIAYAKDEATGVDIVGRLNSAIDPAYVRGIELRLAEQRTRAETAETDLRILRAMFGLHLDSSTIQPPQG